MGGELPHCDAALTLSGTLSLSFKRAGKSRAKRAIITRGIAVMRIAGERSVSTLPPEIHDARSSAGAAGDEAGILKRTPGDMRVREEPIAAGGDVSTQMGGI